MATTVIDTEHAPAGTTGATTERATRRNPLPLIVLALALTAGGYWGYTRWAWGQMHESTENAQIDGHIIPVIARVGGYVRSVNAAENQHVAGEAALVAIDDREYKVRVAQADADLAAARAASGVRGFEGQAAALVQTTTNQRAVTDAQVVAAKAQLTRAQSDLERANDLVAKQIVSRAQLDAAQAAFDAAVANVVATERQVNAAQSNISGAQAGVRLASARLLSAEAARESAALQLSYTTVSTPVTGTVAKKLVEVGQLVQPGQTLMSVVADTGTFITANFKETQLGQIHPGQRVEFEVDAYAGAKAEGEVESISSATGARFALLPPDNATGNFTKVVQRIPVRIRITRALGPDKPLRPGMSVVAHVITK
ncbi:MAG: HlyD family secretion protein [Phycisphaerae bacterium]|nr:HlyD family secretion protein [Gemmatimonadaceae bacterium]